MLPCLCSALGMPLVWLCKPWKALEDSTVSLSKIGCRRGTGGFARPKMRHSVSNILKLCMYFEPANVWYEKKYQAAASSYCVALDQHQSPWDTLYQNIFMKASKKILLGAASILCVALLQREKRLKKKKMGLLHFGFILQLCKEGDCRREIYDSTGSIFWMLLLYQMRRLVGNLGFAFT